MKDSLKRVKFEYIYAILIILILAIALFVFRNDKDITNMTMTALIGASSSITAFFFTRTQINNKYDNERENNQK